MRASNSIIATFSIRVVLTTIMLTVTTTIGPVHTLYFKLGCSVMDSAVSRLAL